MPDFTIKQHDTWPPIRATLADAVGSVDLSTATTVKVLLKGSTVLVDGVCVVNPDQVTNRGKITYTWVTGDTNVADVYECEFEVTWGDGTIETFPNDSYKSVEIKADLG